MVYKYVHATPQKRRYARSHHPENLPREGLRQPSCCGDPIAREARSSTRPSAISPTCRPTDRTIRRRLAGETLGGEGRGKSFAVFPMGTSPPCWARCGRSAWRAMLASRPSRERSLVVALIVMRLILRRNRSWPPAVDLREETATDSLAVELGLGEICRRGSLSTRPWIGCGRGRTRIETKLAKRHLQDGTLVLYDVSSSYYTGHACGLVQVRLQPRDGKKGFPQIVYGLLCNAEGCPVAIEVFQGNTADPKTLGPQIEKLRKRFGVTAGGAGGRSGHDHQQADRRVDARRGRTGLDHGLAGRQHPEAGFPGPDPAVVVRPARPGRDAPRPTIPGSVWWSAAIRFLAEQRSAEAGGTVAATEKKLEEIAAATSVESRRPLREQGPDRSYAWARCSIITRWASTSMLEIEEQHVYRTIATRTKIAAEAAAGRAVCDSHLAVAGSGLSFGGHGTGLQGPGQSGTGVPLQ